LDGILADCEQGIVNVPGIHAQDVLPGNLEGDIPAERFVTEGKTFGETQEESNPGRGAVQFERAVVSIK